MANTPWWAVPLIGGAFAILGVLIAQSVTLRLERRRHTREDHHRLDAALRESALAYIEAVHTYATFVTALNVGDVLIHGGPTDGDDWFSEYSARSRDVDNAVATLSLTATPELLDLAETFHEPWSRFNHAAQGVPMTERLKYTHADEAYNLIQPFRNAVRVHLGLQPLPLQSPTNLAKYAED